MSKQKAYMISCSDHYHHRFHVVDAWLQKKGYDTTYITSDFDHTAKKTFVCSVPNCVQLPAIPYSRNLSFERILSHRNFSRDVFRYPEKMPDEPNVLFVQLPPNFLGYYAKKYKKRHPKVKLFFEIFDMWPETFPFKKMKRLLAPVFAVWAWIRNSSLDAADFVVTECELFREKLKLQENGAAVYLCAESMELEPVSLPEDELSICYLGAINNVIDIPRICGLLAQLTKSRKVKIHIIGKGEREQEFVSYAKDTGAEVVFHGAVYDEREKQKIMSTCHFGLNVMKDSVCVGLTMKSVDYFRNGLPIINSVPGDSRKLVMERKIGVQLEENCASQILSLREEDYLTMRKNVRELFAEQFDKRVVENRYGELLDSFLNY